MDTSPIVKDGKIIRKITDEDWLLDEEIKGDVIIRRYINPFIFMYYSVETKITKQSNLFNFVK